MKSKYKRPVVNGAGVLAGPPSDSATQADRVKTLPAYVIAEVSAITDPIAMKDYGAKVLETLTPFNGRFVVRGGKSERLEGDAPSNRIIVIAFDSFEQAHAWCVSPAYAAILPMRQGVSEVRMFIVEGVAPYGSPTTS